MVLNVEFVPGAPLTRAAARDIATRNRETLRTLFPKMEGTAFDERTGELVVHINGLPAEAATYEAQAATLTTQLGITTRVIVRPNDLRPAAVRGGRPTHLINGGQLRSTTGFVGRNSSNAPGMIGAGHCDEAQEWRESASVYRFNTTPYYDGWADFSFNTASVDMVPWFDANIGVTRVLKGRRTKANTTQRSGGTQGTYVCFFGRVSGSKYGQQCGEVTNVWFNPQYSGPQQPYGCSNGPTFVHCEYNFIYIEPRGTEKMYCIGGDSGAPVFAYDIAFGIVSGCSHKTDASGNVIDEAWGMVYTSTDEPYLFGFTLQYG